MKEFDSYKSYWDFVKSVTWESRYLRTKKQQEFLDTVLYTSASRSDEVAEATLLWRSQLGHDWKDVVMDGEPDQEPWPFPAERMKPLRYEASEGRVNPKGLPYLYLSTDLNTAVAEARPWVGAFVSVAQMKVLRHLRVVDLSKEPRRLMVYAGEPDANERERAVWQDLNVAFSQPATRNDSIAEYVPTQIIAELFRCHGFDGICYQSALGRGRNIALFDIDAAEVMNCSLYTVGKIDFTIDEENRYFVKT